MVGFEREAEGCERLEPCYMASRGGTPYVFTHAEPVLRFLESDALLI